SSTIIPFPLSLDLVSLGVFVDDSSSRSLMTTPLLHLVEAAATLTGAAAGTFGSVAGIIILAALTGVLAAVTTSVISLAVNRALESINETPAQKAANMRRLNEEAKDVKEIKQHLEIMPDEDDDVYTEATPLVRKAPVVDYQIIQLNNKPRYKIIRADGTHQLYVSFITLLKNFDREDFESLWSIVKERLSTSKPNNYFDDYLLTTLRAMFGRTYSKKSVHGQAQVKSWKLLESCGVHIIS
nr:hypothetical protein [Tanacetum cinerariifolium]